MGEETRDEKTKPQGEEEKLPTLQELTFDEVNAILVHKWYLSQNENRDVGMEYAKDDIKEVCKLHEYFSDGIMYIKEGG